MTPEAEALLKEEMVKALLVAFGAGFRAGVKSATPADRESDVVPELIEYELDRAWRRFNSEDPDE